MQESSDKLKSESSIEKGESAAQSSENTSDEPKYKKIIVGANALSLGISMIAAILIGIGLGIGLEKLSGWKFLFWLGVAFGILAAILNVYKAYLGQLREFEELENNPKYKR